MSALDLDPDRLRRDILNLTPDQRLEVLGWLRHTTPAEVRIAIDGLRNVQEEE